MVDSVVVQANLKNNSFSVTLPFVHIGKNDHGIARLHVPTRVLPWFHPATYILNNADNNLNSCDFLFPQYNTDPVGQVNGLFLRQTFC